MASETETLPVLEHGIAPPGDLLPGTPWWVWAVITLASLLVLVGIFRIRRSIQRPVLLETPPLPDYYLLAKKKLKALQDETADRPVSEIAAEASLSVRGFLSGALSEPALYETSEEFSRRTVELPKDAEELLQDLNKAKYFPSQISSQLAGDLVGRSLACLKTLHAANTLAP